MNLTAFAAITSILVAGTALFGGSSTSVPSQETPSTSIHNGSKVLRINLFSEPPSVDPALADDKVSAAVVRATFDGLTRTGKDGKPYASMAMKIDISADFKTYTFHLRDAKWSNGDPVTAYDFEYAWKRVLDPKTAANYAYQLYYIKNAEKFNNAEGKAEDVGVKALDEKTLQVTLENPSPYFLELTAFHTYYPVNKKVVEANPDWAAQAKTHVGNGPFSLQTWEHRSRLELVKNESYWDKDAVKLDRIECYMVEDEYTELSMFDNGEIDWAGAPLGSLPTEELPALKASGSLVMQPIAGVYFYKFNTEQAPFNNTKIRKAFAYAINRQSIIDNVTQANQQPAMGLVPPTMSVSANRFFKDNDGDTAKKLLAEGMKELGIKKLPPITLTYNTSEGHKMVAEAIKDQWKKALGVEVKLENKEWKAYLDDLHHGNYQIGRFGWLGDFNDAINFLDLFKQKDSSSNDTNWENPKYQELLNKSNREGDPVKRKQLLAEAEKLFMEEMPVAPIYFYTQSWVKKDNVKGVIIDGLGFVDWKWATIE